MEASLILSPETWAKHTFGGTDLGDVRRTKRAVSVAASLMRNPSASLPQQMVSHAGLKAAYSLFAEEDVSYTALVAHHWQETRDAAAQQALVLMVQDTTELDYTVHPTTTNLGPIGNGGGRGLLLHTMLAVVPHPRQVLGIAFQEPFRRIPAPEGERQTERFQRQREWQVWSRAVQALDRPSPSCLRVHVGDRGSDIFDYMDACLKQGDHFLIRATCNRRVRDVDNKPKKLFDFVRTWPRQGDKLVDVPAHKHCPARQATVSLAYGRVTLVPPQRSQRREPLTAWVVHVWEMNPPAAVKGPLEWVLLTSVETTTVEAAWERVDWYTCRWLVEDYHQCLKTGCSIEKRQLQDGERLMRLLGFLALVAVWLLQLRDMARRTPDCLASAALPREVVELVAVLARVPAASLTVQRFWWEVARQGGYLGRRRDGPPGWKTLWRGWLHIQTLLQGVLLAKHLPP